jgi:hypothetical protein
MPGAMQSGDGFPLESPSAEEHEPPAADVCADRRFVVARVGWASDGRPPFVVLSQGFDPARAKGGPELIVNTAAAAGRLHHVIAALAEGRLAVGWEDLSRDDRLVFRGQVFNADGSRWGPEFVLAATWADE